MRFVNLDLRHGLLLAPMAGVTDHAFRTLCREKGAEYTCTEMISAKGMHYRDKKTAVLAAIDDAERPTAIQIFGHEPEIMAEAAASLAERYRPAAIDINMGCPVKKIVSGGDGSALMRDLPLAAEVIRAVVKAVGALPVTVKIRAGWDAGSVNAVEAAKIAEAEGAAAVCVHGRTKDQMYRPPADLGIIRRVKEAVSIPVIGNGGIKSASDALEMFRDTGCDGVMVARGACGNPWIFSEILAALEGRPYIPPSPEERITEALRHASMLAADKGERQGIREARGHIAWYIKNLPGSAAARNKINSAATLDAVKNILYNQ